MRFRSFALVLLLGEAVTVADTQAIFIATLNGDALDHHISQEEGSPIAEVSCRVGYTEHHGIFALLHLALPVFVLHFKQKRVPRLLSGSIGASAVLTVASYALLGGICWSPTISAVVHAHFASFPVLRLAGLLYALNCVATAAVSSHCVALQSEGTVRKAKLAILSVLALLNILAQCWWWTDDVFMESTLMR